MRWLDGITDSMDVGLSRLRQLVDGQEGLACCDSWGRKESDTNEQLNRTELKALPGILIPDVQERSRSELPGTKSHRLLVIHLISSLFCNKALKFTKNCPALIVVMA